MEGNKASERLSRQPSLEAGTDGSSWWMRRARAVPVCGPSAIEAERTINVVLLPGN
jgi:hypothetical protein